MVLCCISCVVDGKKTATCLFYVYIQITLSHFHFDFWNQQILMSVFSIRIPLFVKIVLFSFCFKSPSFQTSFVQSNMYPVNVTRYCIC